MNKKISNIALLFLLLSSCASVNEHKKITLSKEPGIYNLKLIQYQRHDNIIIDKKIIRDMNISFKKNTSVPIEIWLTPHYLSQVAVLEKPCKNTHHENVIKLSKIECEIDISDRPRYGEAMFFGTISKKNNNLFLDIQNSYDLIEPIKTTISFSNNKKTIDIPIIEDKNKLKNYPDLNNPKNLFPQINKINYSFEISTL